MGHCPKISLGLPVFNGEEFVSQAIESALAQTYGDFELVITDNASTDNTSDLCIRYAAQDSRIRYYRSDMNLGAAPNFNWAFELSSGEYFKWMAHDDIIAPSFLQRCVDVLDHNSSVVLSFSNVTIIDESGREVDQYDLDLNTDSADPAERYRSLLLDWHMCFDVFGLIRSDALRRTPVMGNYGHGDGVLLARLALMGAFYKSQDYLFYSRRHDKQSMRQFGYSLERGGNDYHAYAAWFDAAHREKLVFPRWRMLQEYHDAVQCADVSWTTKVRSYRYLARWIARNRRPLLNDLVIAGRHALSGRGHVAPSQVAALE